MADLKTTYLGLKLKNPFIAGASNLVSNPDNLKLMEDSGAAAIVYKSLFEEQIQLERLELEEDLSEYQERNAEMISLFPNIEHAGPEEHLVKLRHAKESVKIPVIASLNCIFTETWTEYAKLIQQTGVDALEINFFAVPKNFTTSGKDILDAQLEVLNALKKVITIPISLKLSPFYANPLHAIKQFDQTGANGVVLFNRFLQPDIDVTSGSFVNHFSPSSPEESLLPLRYAGLLFENINASICCSSGIYSGKDVAKMILAGADCIQTVSALYKHKIPHLTTMINELSSWMDSKNYKSINDFKGKLSKARITDPYIYKRAQYIDILMRTGEIFKKYPVR
ncbi:MAG: dihydroorotate dehydrogenase-like protein [Bacteroidota bacterium]|nr:dihydroorotate dehydrogenase-like protein [Bacteroidota bacterium]